MKRKKMKKTQSFMNYKNPLWTGELFLMICLY